jgi:hypothetical protein
MSSIVVACVSWIAGVNVDNKGAMEVGSITGGAITEGTLSDGARLLGAGIGLSTGARGMFALPALMGCESFGGRTNNSDNCLRMWLALLSNGDNGELKAYVDKACMMSLAAAEMMSVGDAVGMVTLDGNHASVSQIRVCRDSHIHI